MTRQQFDLLIVFLRGQSNTPANQSARLVLIEGFSQAQAAQYTGATRSTVADAVKRYREADQAVKFAYWRCMYAPISVQFEDQNAEGAAVNTNSVTIQLDAHTLDLMAKRRAGIALYKQKPSPELRAELDAISDLVFQRLGGLVLDVTDPIR